MAGDDLGHHKRQVHDPEHHRVQGSGRRQGGDRAALQQVQSTVVVGAFEVDRPSHVAFEIDSDPGEFAALRFGQGRRTTPIGRDLDLVDAVPTGDGLGVLVRDGLPDDG